MYQGRKEVVGGVRVMLRIHAEWLGRIIFHVTSNLLYSTVQSARLYNIHFLWDMVVDTGCHQLIKVQMLQK